MFSPEVDAAVVSAVPATMAAVAAWRAARKTHKEVRTNHGKRQGEYVEQISSDLKDLAQHTTSPLVNRQVIRAIDGVRDELRAHTAQDAENFASIMRLIAERN